MNKFTVKVIDFDKPTKNGNIYSKECIKSIPKEILITKQANGSLSDTIAKATVIVKDDGVYIEDITPLAVEGTPYEIKKYPHYYIQNNKRRHDFNILIKTANVRTAGIGAVDKNGVVTEYELKSAFFTMDPA